MSANLERATVDFETTSKWVALLALLLSIGNLVWAWISQPARDVAKRIDDVDDRVDKVCEDMKVHDRRIQRTEDDVRHLPTKDDLHSVTQTLSSVKTELDIVARVVTRLDDFLRKQP